ncbi:hypothetical protein CMO96_04635 [Candidatus Woesebacteria bacterium]|nr:hypothetical protein [Candidatus Woesebacteria bacterium]
MSKKYATVKQILHLAGIGAFIAGSLILPGLPRLLRGRALNYDDFFPAKKWDDFDGSRLRQRLKELHKQKVVRIYQTGDKFVVQITKKGRKRLLKYKLNNLKIPEPKKWDGKWRIVAYDIPKEKNSARDALRATLKRFNFLELQKSVYLYPYPCADMVEFIRELYGVGEHVTFLTVGNLEDENAYKEHFKL